MKQAPILSEEALKTLLADAPVEMVAAEQNSDESVPTSVVAEVIENVAPVEPSAEAIALEALKVEFEAYKAEAELKLADLEAKVSETDELKNIVAGQLLRMRVALKLGAVDCVAMSAGEVVKEFNATSTQFMKALPVGSVVPVEKEEEPLKAIQSSLDESSYRSLGFGTKK
jgi:hypothetical protein